MKIRPFVVPSLFIGGALFVLSGACSQHEPGTFQGGGRDMGTVVVGPAGGGPQPPPDSGLPDIFELPDNFAPDTGKDTGGNDGAFNPG